MSMDRMDQVEFEDLAARYGPEPEAWPATRRAAAEALMAASPEARDFAAAMAAVGDGLDDLRQAEASVSAELSARILGDAASVSALRSAAPEPTAAAKAPSLGERLAAFLAPVWRPAAACAASAAVGLVIGYVAPAGVAEASGAIAALEAAEEFVGVGDDESFEIALLGETDDWGGLE